MKKGMLLLGIFGTVLLLSSVAFAGSNKPMKRSDKEIFRDFMVATKNSDRNTAEEKFFAAVKEMGSCKKNFTELSDEYALNSIQMFRKYSEEIRVIGIDKFQEKYGTVGNEIMEKKLLRIYFGLFNGRYQGISEETAEDVVRNYESGLELWQMKFDPPKIGK